MIRFNVILVAGLLCWTSTASAHGHGHKGSDHHSSQLKHERSIEHIVKREAGYILSCQYINPSSAAFYAISTAEGGYYFGI